MSNEMPRFSDTSTAIVNRMVFLRMTKSFLGKEDLELSEKLAAELPSIFNWSLDGMDRLARTGRFTETETARDAAQQMRELASPIAAFLDDTCDLGPEFLETKDALYYEYRLWADRQNMRAVNKSVFMRNLNATADVQPTRLRDGDTRTHAVRGVRLRRRPFQVDTSLN